MPYISFHPFSHLPTSAAPRWSRQNTPSHL
nr:MAG TPA: hypothetical protein [Caudoviricetes sp.]